MTLENILQSPDELPAYSAFALVAEFGEQWQNYRRRVLMLIPHLRKESHA